MKNYYLTLIVFLMLPSILWCQHTETEYVRCGTMERLEELKQQDPGILLKQQDIEEKIQQLLAQGQFEKGGEPSITIPVVFHIIHNGDEEGSGENIADGFIFSQLEQLNDDFRRMNADVGSTPEEFLDEAADTGIEFCLAQQDPDGNATTGIERIHINTLTGVSTGSCWTQSYIDANIKPPTIWDSRRYLNIWVLAKIERVVSGVCRNDILGYAQFPGGATNTDGVVLLFSTLGSLSNPFPGASPYDLGRTATHEVGHWLNLIHIWGDDGSACSGSDQVADTPNQGGANIGCPTHPHVSCSSNDMFMNYMDYSDDNCFNMFTLGQANRMQAAIAASRPNLDPTLCAALNPCVQHLFLTPTNPGTVTGTAEFEAEQTITATNTIASAATVDYHAGQMVLLQANFLATAGSNFHAFILGCTDFGVDGGLVFRAEEEDTQPNRSIQPDLPKLSVYPNPSGPGDLNIELSVFSGESVSLYLFNPNGKIIGSLLQEQILEAGKHKFVFSGHDLAAGIYFIRLVQGAKLITQKIVILD